MANGHQPVVLITGGGRGLGRATARRFREAGAHVIVTVRGMTEVDDGLEAERIDVTDRAAIEAMRERIAQRHGRIDVLVNNAAVMDDDDDTNTADRLDGEVVRRTLDVNVVALVNVTTTLLPLVPDGGRIINVSSNLGQLDGGMSANWPAYGISKAAVNAYTSALAAALQRRNIRVDSLHPGWLQTDMGGSSAPEPPDAGAERIYALATVDAKAPTGRFWENGAPAPW